MLLALRAQSRGLVFRDVYCLCGVVRGGKELSLPKRLIWLWLSLLLWSWYIDWELHSAGLGLEGKKASAVEFSLDIVGVHMASRSLGTWAPLGWRPRNRHQRGLSAFAQGSLSYHLLGINDGSSNGLWF